jgi:uncharacterized protein (TIGR02996 family)
VTLEGAFLADIIENPDDDSLRLIYAGWLDDHGRPATARTECTGAAVAGGARAEVGRPRRRLGRLAGVNLSGTIHVEERRRALQARFGGRVRQLHAERVTRAAPLRPVRGRYRALAPGPVGLPFRPDAVISRPGRIGPHGRPVFLPRPLDKPPASSHVSRVTGPHPA